MTILDIDPKIKRTAGISYREIGLVFADSQQVTLRIKQPGAIYQVLVNELRVRRRQSDRG